MIVSELVVVLSGSKKYLQSIRRSVRITVSMKPSQLTTGADSNYFKRLAELQFSEPFFRCVYSLRDEKRHIFEILGTQSPLLFFYSEIVHLIAAQGCFGA